MFTPEQYEAARMAADTFNSRHGGELLLVAPRPIEAVTWDELRRLAQTRPGEYVAANAYRAIKGRKPDHGEVVKLGHLLGFLSVARRKEGGTTLWLLDNAFAQRSH